MDIAGLEMNTSTRKTKTMFGYDKVGRVGEKGK